MARATLDGLKLGDIRFGGRAAAAASMYQLAGKVVKLQTPLLVLRREDGQAAARAARARARGGAAARASSHDRRASLPLARAPRAARHGRAEFRRERRRAAAAAAAVRRRGRRAPKSSSTRADHAPRRDEQRVSDPRVRGSLWSSWRPFTVVRAARRGGSRRSASRRSARGARRRRRARPCPARLRLAAAITAVLAAAARGGRRRRAGRSAAPARARRGAARRRPRAAARAPRRVRVRPSSPRRRRRRGGDGGAGARRRGRGRGRRRVGEVAELLAHVEAREAAVEVERAAPPSRHGANGGGVRAAGHVHGAAAKKPCALISAASRLEPSRACTLRSSSASTKLAALGLSVAGSWSGAWRMRSKSTLWSFV